MKELTWITRENVLRDRPFGKPARMINRFESEGWSIKKIYEINKWNFIEKLNEIEDNSVIIASGSKAGILSLLARKFKKNIKVIHDWQDDYSMIQKQIGFPGNIFYPIYNKIENYIIKSSDAVAAIAKSLQHRGKKIGVNCVYTPCGVDKKLFDRASGDRIKEEYDRPILLYIGAVGKFKNVHLLVKAVKNLDCYLLIVGFDFPKEIRENASDNVIYVGRKPHEEIPNYIDAADICCSPQDWDGGLKLFEYLYMKKAILSVKGKPEFLLTHRKNAFLSDISVEGFRKSIKILLQDEKLRKRLERNSRTVRVYDWKEIFQIYKKLIKNVMKKCEIGL